jgi:CheY-like chemotaxis protein
VTYSELHAAGASGQTEMATILVVEDEFGIAEVLESVLVEAGHDVVTAINGKQGLERLTEKPPQLVLLDFMMPVLDGPGMLRAMKNDPAYRAIPAVIMSSLPESAVAEGASGLYSGFLRKPFKLHAVIEVINRVLKENRF